MKSASRKLIAASDHQRRVTRGRMELQQGIEIPRVLSTSVEWLPPVNYRKPYSTSFYS